MTPTERPHQAVILAGGQGTRLRPLTLARPKHMIEFHGRPFLAYLVEMLREQGFRRLLLLLGYLPDCTREYFGDGRQLEVRIQYSVCPVEWETTRRLAAAAPLLDPRFLLLYCDNYWPLRFPALWRRWRQCGAPALMTVYDNLDSWTRSNVALDERGRIAAYDKTRSRAGLDGVDIGFLLLERELLTLLPDENVPLESAFYPRLIEQGRMAAYVTSHRYYSVGSTERLPLTAEFLARRPAVILDRDGVLNLRPAQAEYVRSWDDWKWLPGAREALALLAASGWRVIVTSNQAGIARGELSEEALQNIHQRMRQEAEAAGGRIDAVYHCPHSWEDGCRCRKPAPGMLYQAQRDFPLDLTRTWFLGDDERDAQAAEAAGCRFGMVSGEQSLLDWTRLLCGGQTTALEEDGCLSTS